MVGKARASPSEIKGSTFLGHQILPRASAGDYPDAHGCHSRMERIRGTEPWGCSGPLGPDFQPVASHLSGEKLLGLGRGLMGFSEKPRLPLTCSL